MSQRRNQIGNQKLFWVEWILKQNRWKLWTITKAMLIGKFVTLNVYNTEKESF